MRTTCSAMSAPTTAIPRLRAKVVTPSPRQTIETAAANRPRRPVAPGDAWVSGRHPTIDRSGSDVGCVRLRVGDVRRPAARRRRPARPRRPDSWLAAAPARSHLSAPASAGCARAAGERASVSVATRGLQCQTPCAATGRTNASMAAAPSRWDSPAGRAGRRSRPTSAAAPPNERDPGCERRTAVAEAVLEVARPERLEHDPADEGGGEHEHRAREQCKRSGESERQRREARRAPRLRQRDRIREVNEDHGTSSSTRTTSVPPSANATQRRGQRERRHRQRARAPRRQPRRCGRHLRSQPVVVLVRHDELVCVLPERAGALACARIVGVRLVDDRPQPEQREPDRDDCRR